MATPSTFRAYAAIALFLAFVPVAPAQYSGGSGTADDPYQIATAADLIALGETPEDYDKHFILTADIDLDPNLPGGKIFDRAVIAPDVNDTTLSFEGTPFTGVFDGKGHTISHLTITGANFLGLFGQMGSGATVRDLGVLDVNIAGSGSCIGALVGANACYQVRGGILSNCYTTGSVNGKDYVGGLVGSNGDEWGRFLGGSITNCHSSGLVGGSRTRSVGGLVGSNGYHGNITNSYSSGSVNGSQSVGGLVGSNSGSIAACYSSGSVSGGSSVGGLVGSGSPDGVSACAWDTETSGLSGSAGGVGLTTGEMMDPYVLGLNGFANDPNWILDTGRDYPRLAWEGTLGNMIPEPEIDWLEGEGTAEAPYRIDTPEQLIFLGRAASALWNRHFVLGADIDLDPTLPGRVVFAHAVIPVFTGVFDGRGHVISNLRIERGSYLGVFGHLVADAEVRNVGVVDVNITNGSYAGGLVGVNGGSIANCHGSGSVFGNSYVGGLVGENWGSIASSYSTASVFGNWHVGGLVGWNNGWRASIVSSYNTGAVSGNDEVGGLVGHSGGSIVSSYNTGAVSGNDEVGGLVGYNAGRITTSYNTGAVSGIDYKTSGWGFDYSSSVGGLTGTNYGSITASYSSGPVSGYQWVGGLAGMNGGEAALCYSTATVTGHDSVGGLIGENDGWRDDRVGGYVSRCYCAGLVVGYRDVGGLVGSNPGRVVQSVWDMKTSRLSGSAGGVGLTTGEMMAPYMLGLNGFGNDPNWVLDSGRDYPRLAWENSPGQIIPKADVDWLEGTGTSEDPYRIDNAQQLVFLGRASALCDRHFTLSSDIDLAPNLPSGNVFSQAVIPYFAGVFDGNGHTISHVTIKGASLRNLVSYLGEFLRVESEDSGLGGSHLGLFGHLDVGAEVRNLGVVDVRILGTTHVGGLVGRNEGDVAACYCTGVVTGRSYVGGLVGGNQGTVGECYSTGATSGGYSVGGLVGGNFYGGAMSDSYSTGVVTGQDNIGGLVGTNWGGDIVAASLWNTETSGQTASVGGEGKISAEMQTAGTFLDVGWDFLDETANGTEDFWWIDEGRDYPRLWWEYGRVFSPDPWDGVRDVPSPLTLQWIGGGAEFCHDVYFGDDEAAVANATSETQGFYRGRQAAGTTTYDPGTLEWAKTYYWRIDEVGEAEPNSPWKGSVRSFTTADFIVVTVVDDFESYTDDMKAGEAIFQTWLDGFGYGDPNTPADDPNHFPYYPGNGTGSLAGYMGAPFAEQWIAYGGGQSMPIDYDNADEPWYSEAERTWETPQDWTIDVGDTVTLYFLAGAVNDPDPLYVRIEDSSGRMAVVVHPDAEAVLATQWRKWHIALADVQAAGADTTAVRKMVIGVGDRDNPQPGGAGRIYIDDIRLTRRMP
ncbi:GLUG motif-containing protein [Anaerobaca lacustris]|uniref:GLUG motif-containing protein n=1 Tax=Anaerobaca lacustris TaxID=3044600 RepID=A0AAW6U9K4_9BACT|nr:GLUG motif-containing protein [Sedimentisphaerales bacterium M17dextr]